VLCALTVDLIRNSNAAGKSLIVKYVAMYSNTSCLFWNVRLFCPILYVRCIDPRWPLRVELISKFVAILSLGDERQPMCLLLFSAFDLLLLDSANVQLKNRELVAYRTFMLAVTFTQLKWCESKLVYGSCRNGFVS